MMLAHPLSLMIALPLVALAALFFVPSTNVGLVRRIAHYGTFLPFLLSLWVFFAYDKTVGGFQFVDQLPWVAPLGISYHLGVDGINALMAVLLGFGSLTAVMCSNIKERAKEYYILILAMIVGTYAAFLSLDIFMFYFAHEIAAIPTFLLIAVWGSERKEYAAMKLTLYLTAGATFALIGILALYHATGLHTFDLPTLQQYLSVHPLPVAVQNWIFPLIAIGFGVTLTLWPFYTWAPVGYSSAPTAVSMLHAGVLKKLGAYAIIRFAILLMPEGAHTWMPLIATLAVMNILYCGFVALTQRDMKYILAYSSCSHMGYILLGLACMNVVGLNGVVFLMFAHGIMAVLGFALNGFFADQTGTRNLDELGGLTKKMPFIAVCFSMMALASAGVPGFANFPAEIMVLLGSWDHYRWQTIFAVLGLVITAVYMLKTIRLGFQGPLGAPWGQLKDAVTVVAKLPYILLLAALIVAGCFPSLILNKIEPVTKGFFVASTK